MGHNMKTIEERARDFAIEKSCTECKHNSECENNKSAKCALVLRYDVMYLRIANDQQNITKREMIEKACEAYCKVSCCGKPPRKTCLSLGTCDAYDRFKKILEE